MDLIPLIENKDELTHLSSLEKESGKEIEQKTLHSSNEETSFVNEENLPEGSLAFSDSDDETKLSLFFNESDNEDKTAETSQNEVQQQSNEVQVESFSSITSGKIQKKFFEDSECEEKAYSYSKPVYDKENEKNKKYSIVDSDTESEGKSNEGVYDFQCSSEDEQNVKKVEKKIKSNSSPRKKTVRKAAKVAMETIDAIKSETQRLHRENNISVPYHQPKRCTLKEFMARKTVSKPDIGTFYVKRFSVKMNKEQLKDYAKFLQKREKEAENLFADDNIDRKLPIKKCNESFSDQGIDKNEFDDSNDDIDNFLTVPLNGQQREDCDNEDNLVETNKLQEKLILKNTVNICAADLTEENLVNAESEKLSIDDNIHEKVEKPKIEIISNVQISPAIVKQPREVVMQLKQKITEEALNSKIRPKLSGSPASIIDLESGDILPPRAREPTGVDKLLQKYFSSNFRKHTLKINGKIDEEFDLTESNKDNRPGASYLKLKNNLMRQIKEQRKIEIGKKLKHHKEEEEITSKIFEEEDYEDICNNPSIKNAVENEENDDEMEEIDYSDKIKHISNEENVDEEESNHLVFNDESDVDGDDESDGNEVYKVNQAKRKRNKRIVREFNESGSENDEPAENIVLSLKYPLEETEVENPELAKDKSTLTNSAIEKLCDVKNDRVGIDEELLELCSGTFEKTQMENSKKFYSQSNNSTQINQTDFENKSLENYKKNNFAESNNDDAGQSSEEEILSRQQLKYKKNNIEYSDEEDNIVDKISMQLASNSEESEIDQDEPVATFIDFDSDENEVRVDMTKKDINIKATEFFEHEAELSESEWGSADEDEKNLDKYDIELGDEDEFDQEKLKDELGRIHMRKMLDDDARQLKKMQELLFDDEENDGIGRQRQFRWKKAETAFNFDDSNNKNLNEPIRIDSNDEDDEEIWRKMKHEREILLKERLEPNDLLPFENKTGNVLENSIEKNLIMSKVTSMSISKSKLNESENKNDSPFLISKSSIRSVRGSFLKRDRATLTKVAGITTHTSEFDGISTVQNRAGKNKNFIFSILSEKPDESNKRKLSSNSNINFNNAKKVKLQPKSEYKIKKSIIDHLDNM